MRPNPTAAATADAARTSPAASTPKPSRRTSAAQRDISGRLMAALCAGYTIFHVGVMYLYPLEPWVYRLIHVGGGLAIGFLLFSSTMLPDQTVRTGRAPRSALP
jgi:hypothetical protein